MQELRSVHPLQAQLKAILNRPAVALLLFCCSALPAGRVLGQTTPEPAVIVINAANDATKGAAVRIDGEPAGSIPFRVTISPGRHLVQVGKRGYATFSKWVDVKSGEVLTIPAALEPKAPETGSLLVTADVTGLPVFIDGQQRGGTPLVVDGLTEGDHLIEIKSAGEGYREFSEVVRITAGQRTTVNAALRVAPDLGSLRVITNIPGAIVSLDGVDIGTAPAARGGLKPGEHVVMARADGYEPVEQTVSVVAGRERVVSIRLTTPSTGDARIMVRANVPDATVWIDGEDYGEPPITLQPAEFGTHTVVVRAPGHREVRRTCTVSQTRNCDVYAQLFPLGVPVRVEANVADARLFVDGESRGPLPWEGDLPAGDHQLEVRAPGYRSHVEDVDLVESQRIRLIQVILTPEGRGRVEDRRQSESERQQTFRDAVTNSAQPLPVGLTVLDLSGGWPYLVGFGLSTGLTDYLDIGVHVRTFGRLTDFGVTTKAGWRLARVFSAGAQLGIGGGVGPARNEMGRRPTNDFFLSLEGIASLHFPSAGAFSIFLAMDFNSDRWDFAGNDRDQLLPGVGRQNEVRFRLGASLDIVLSRRWNLWFIFEGIPAGDRRRVLGDVFGGGREDTRIYGRLGATFKFGTDQGGR